MRTNSHRSKLLSKSERESRRNKTVAFVILFIVCIIWVFPFVYILGMSFRTTEDMLLYPTSIFPHSDGWTLSNYGTFFRMSDGQMDVLMNAMLNSLVTTVCHVILSLIVTVLAAYSYVFMRYKGRAFIYTFIIGTMAIPSVIGFAPMFSMFISVGKSWDVIDSLAYFYAWLIFPGVSGAFNLMIMVNFFSTVPMDVVESARSDGASEFHIFRKVVLPLARSSILVCALFSFNGSWNNFLFPQLLVSTQSDTQAHNTITVALMGWIQNGDVSLKGLAMASCVFSLIPLLVMYAVTQNKMIDGLASTGVKR